MNTQLTDNPLICLLIIGLFLMLSCNQSDSEDSMAIDNSFEEWETIPAIFQSEEAIRKIKITDSEKYMYLYFQIEDSINIQSFQGSIQLEIIETSCEDGEVLTIVFSKQDGSREGGYGAGSGIRLNDTLNWLSPYLAEIIITPVSYSNTFEMRLSKTFFIDNSEYILPDDIQLSIKYSDHSASQFTKVNYKTTGQAFELKPAVHLEKSKDDTRILSWNVADIQFKQNPNLYKRVFDQLQPDIVMLDEVNNDVSRDQLTSLLNSDWNFVISDQGGRQKTVVGSKYPLEKIQEICNILYPSEALKKLLDRYPSQTKRINIEREANIASCGVWLKIDGKNILLTSLDLFSSGHHNSINDDFRLLQSSLISSTIKSVNPNNKPIIIGGDFNLVGSNEPMETLMGTDRKPLLHASGYHLNDNVNYTWRQANNGSWTPGQLDYILHSAELKEANSFTFKLEDVLSSEELQRISEHYPVVFDIEM